ncbi:MAG: hypothetical protein P1U63_00365 [Coxiellaceae bacterium]|nr:hypothetical protein [Coxiellaceae bacterium]
MSRENIVELTPEEKELLADTLNEYGQDDTPLTAAEQKEADAVANGSLMAEWLAKPENAAALNDLADLIKVIATIPEVLSEEERAEAYAMSDPETTKQLIEILRNPVNAPTLLNTPDKIAALADLLSTIGYVAAPEPTAAPYSPASAAAAIGTFAPTGGSAAAATSEPVPQESDDATPVTPRR